MMERASYEQDFYGWALEQAEALRRGEPSNVLDFTHLAEEIEGLARSDRRACESFLEAICLHLLLLTYSTLNEPRTGWRREVLAFRRGLRRRLSPSLEAQLHQPDALAALCAAALQDARSRLEEFDPVGAERLPREAAFAWAELLEDDAPA